MRSIILSLALGSLTATGAIAAAPLTGAPAVQSQCPDRPSMHLARPGKGAPHKKLTDLPPGRAFAAVYRRDERGCVVPVLYSDRYSNPRRRPAAPR